jgi:hypothetical protein
MGLGLHGMGVHGMDVHGVGVHGVGGRIVDMLGGACTVWDSNSVGLHGMDFCGIKTWSC